MTFRVTATILMLLVLSLCSFAESGTSLGMAGAYTALARGVDAIYWNPANLGLKDGSRSGSMMLLNASAGLGNNSINQAMYNEFFTNENKVLSTEDVDRLLASIPDDKGLELETLTDISLFSFAFGNFGFGFSTSSYSQSYLPKQVLEIPLRGISPQTYLFQPGATAEALGKVHVAFGKSLIRYQTLYVFNRPVLDIDDIAIGARVSYLFGLGSFRTEQAFVQTLIDDQGVSARGSYYGVGSISENGSIPGSGLGLDVGLSVTTPAQYTFSIVVRNLYQQVTWRENTRAYSGELDTGAPRFIFGDDGITYLDEEEIFTDSEIGLKEYVTSSPRDVRLGLGRSGRFGMYALELGSRYQRFLAAAGGGVSWAMFHLFGGIRYCGDPYYHGGLGLGGEAFMLDVGIASRGGVTQNASKGVVLAGSLRVGW